MYIYIYIIIYIYTNIPTNKVIDNPLLFTCSKTLSVT